VLSVIRAEQSTSDLLISAGSDRKIKLWDPRLPNSVGTINAHDSEITCTTLLAYNEQLATGSLDGHVKVWSFELN
jgi:WD40 repeat protein